MSRGYCTTKHKVRMTLEIGVSGINSRMTVRQELQLQIPTHSRDTVRKALQLRGLDHDRNGTPFVQNITCLNCAGDVANHRARQLRRKRRYRESTRYRETPRSSSGV